MFIEYDFDVRENGVIELYLILNFLSFGLELNFCVRTKSKIRTCIRSFFWEKN